MSNPVLENGHSRILITTKQFFECRNGTRRSDVCVFLVYVGGVFSTDFLYFAYTAPTRNVSGRVNGPTGRNRANNPRHLSPTPMPVDAMASSSSANSLLMAWKPASAPTTKNATAGPYGLIEKIQPLALASPEEQTDNWDDDFEEGISLSKLQGA